MDYKLQFNENPTPQELATSNSAGEQLIKKFAPLFKKYLILIQTGHIDFRDKEMKRFVTCFIPETNLKMALRRDRQSKKMRHEILNRFNFVKETYGMQQKEEIISDLQMCFFILAKRYKQMGRNFCGYLYNVYLYEVVRHIQGYIKNPGNIHYNKLEYEDFMKNSEEKALDSEFEDRMYEDSMGLPGSSWISGLDCSETFTCLDPFERKLIVKYYLEDYNDRQIAEEFCMPVNACNQARRRATFKLADALGVSYDRIQRSRKSGKKALLRLAC